MELLLCGIHRKGSTNECYRYKFIKGSAIGASIFSDVGYFRTLGGLTNGVCLPGSLGVASSESAAGGGRLRACGS